MRGQRHNNTKLWIGCMLTANLFCNSLATRADSDPRSLKHPLIGYWESTLPDTRCLETYWFKEDGTAVFSSGEEQLEARYEVTPQPDAQGFFKLSHRVTQTNHSQDCTQQTSKVGSEQTSFLLFTPDGSRFIACDDDDPSLESCFGPIELKNNANKSLR